MTSIILTPIKNKMRRERISAPRRQAQEPHAERVAADPAHAYVREEEEDARPVLQIAQEVGRGHDVPVEQPVRWERGRAVGGHGRGIKLLSAVFGIECEMCDTK